MSLQVGLSQKDTTTKCWTVSGGLRLLVAMPVGTTTLKINWQYLLS